MIHAECYVNSDSHQMCNIFVKYCSTVIATLFFECLCHFYDILTSFKSFQYWKNAICLFLRSEKILFGMFIEEKTKGAKPMHSYNHN